jgi:hypothetical protein
MSHLKMLYIKNVIRDIKKIEFKIKTMLNENGELWIEKTRSRWDV